MYNIARELTCTRVKLKLRTHFISNTFNTCLLVGVLEISVVFPTKYHAISILIYIINLTSDIKDNLKKREAVTCNIRHLVHDNTLAPSRGI
jgi:hypothetical protein